MQPQKLFIKIKNQKKINKNKGILTNKLGIFTNIKQKQGLQFVAKSGI